MNTCSAQVRWWKPSSSALRAISASLDARRLAPVPGLRTHLHDDRRCDSEPETAAIHTSYPSPSDVTRAPIPASLAPFDVDVNIEECGSTDKR
jgi:hypothetical protein